MEYLSTAELELTVEALRLTIAERVPAIYNKSATLLTALPKMSEFQTQIKWDADVIPGVATGRAITADASKNQAGSIAPAFLPIGDFAITHGFNIKVTSLIQAASNGNAPEALSNLFQVHVNRGTNRILRGLNAAIISGTGLEAQGGVLGLGQVAGAASYANLATATYPEWSATTFQPQDSDLATTTPTDPAVLTKPIMYRMERLLEEREQTYTHIVMSPANKERYKNLFDETRVLQVTNVGSPTNGDVGITNLTFNGRPLVTDNQMPNDIVYFIDAMNTQVATFRWDGTVDVGGLNINVSAVNSQNPYVQAFEIGVMPQLVVWDRRSLGVINLDGIV